MRVATPTNEMIHKSLIHLALAVEQLADALADTQIERAQGAITRCRQQINNAHRQLVEESFEPE